MKKLACLAVLVLGFAGCRQEPMGTHDTQTEGGVQTSTNTVEGTATNATTGENQQSVGAGAQLTDEPENPMPPSGPR